MDRGLLPYLPVEKILACYAAAPGNEIKSGKFLSPESSSALAANVFGLFLESPEELPILPGCRENWWPVESVNLEAIIRFPWSGGRHPCLDVVLQTASAVIGVESKRYEPFRPKNKTELSEAYWRTVWGERMKRYEAVRDGLKDSRFDFLHLDATQLVKHAFGLRTAVNRKKEPNGRIPVLLYIYSEPKAWPDGRPIETSVIQRHRDEIERFADLVAGDEVQFLSTSYAEWLLGWNSSTSKRLSAHHSALVERFFST